MTREEAIHQLQQNKDDWTFIIESQALKMAIKALEQEPCDDCVSREAVIKLVKKGEYDITGETDNEMFLEEVNKLPLVNPQNDVLDKIASEIEEQVKLVESMGCSAKQFRVAWGIVNQYRGE